MTIEGARTLFFSPHLDDVAFSCGGTAARSATLGDRPLVVTLCTAEPDESSGLSEFAGALHEKWQAAGTPAKQLWLTRRAEDQAAMAELGVTHRWLGHHDAIYRGYASSLALFSEPAAEDAAFFARTSKEVVALWRQTQQATVYLPLAIGGHVDHRIGYSLAAPLIAAGAAVWHYEDFPYCAQPGSVERHLEQLGGSWRSHSEDITTHFEQRLRAMSQYTSQLAQVFRDHGGHHETITRKTAESRTDVPGRLAERFWQREVAIDP